MDEIESITNEMLKKERTVLACGGVTLAELVRRYFSTWERDVRPVCLATGRSYYDFLVDVLRQSGREVDKQTLITTLGRARRVAGRADNAVPR